MRRCAAFPLLVSGLGLIASACVSVFPEPQPPPRIYSLNAGPADFGPQTQTVTQNQAQTLAVSPVVIGVALPGGPRALMGAEIAWRTDGVLRFVAGAEWASRAPDMLQAALAEAVDRAGTVRAGVRAGAGVRADYEIAWDVSAFQVEEEDGVVRARFAAVARLVDARTRVLLAQTRVEEVRPVAERSQALAAAALESATRDAVARIARELSPIAVETPTPQ